jgi:tetratricopeptide (TPR) repeat protein
MRWLLILVGLCLCCAAYGQAKKIDSLKATLASSDDTTRIGSLIQIATLYRRINLDSMFSLAERAQQLSIKQNYKKGDARASLLMSTSELRRGRLSKGLTLGERALRISQDNSLKTIEADALNNIGLIHNYQGDYPSALKYYQQALPIAESVRSKKSIAAIYTNIGGVHYNLKDYKLALDYWEKALELQKQDGDKSSIGVGLSNIGMVYADLGDFKMSLSYYFQSFNKYDDKGQCGRLYLLENIGSIYLKLNKPDSAEFYLTQGLRSMETCHDPIASVGILTSLANTYRAKKQYAPAQVQLEKALKMGMKAGLNRETGIAAKSLYELHELMGHTQEALSILKIYNTIQESIYNTENAKAIGRLEAQHEFEIATKEQEAALQIEKLEKEKMISREKWITNTSIAGLVTMIFVVLLFYWNLRRKKLLNERLMLLNDEIKMQREQLQNLNKSLFELNEDLEARIGERTKELNGKNAELENKNAQLANYAFINAHKLRAPVATLLGLVMLFDNKKIENTERDEIVKKIRDCAGDLDETVKEIRITLEKERSQV